MEDIVTTPAELVVVDEAAARTRIVRIVLYCVAVFLYWAALYIYVPTLPTYVESKAASLALVGVVLAQYGVWQAVVRLPLGIASDWLGQRKPFIIAGFILAGVGAVVMGRADGVNGLLVGRAITGLAAAAWVPLVVAFSSLFPAGDAIRATAILTLLNSLGRASATAVTGSLNEAVGYALPFFLAAGLAALAIVAVLPVSEVRRAPKRPSVGAIGRLIVRPDVLLPAVLATISQYGNWATTFGFLPILAEDMGATGVTQSILLSLNIAVLALGQLVATTLAKRLGARTVVLASFVILAVGIGLAAIAPSLPLLFVAQFCIGLSQGIGYPVMMGMSIERVAEESRSTAMGLFQSLYAIGMFGGPALSGVLADAMGIRLMFGVTAVACLLPGVLLTRGLNRRPPVETVK
ncbi:MAG: MFS transporter [Anaerolineales bacterium]|nr:MFS transporter [Anaerolineales bacterium]